MYDGDLYASSFVDTGSNFTGLKNLPFKREEEIRREDNQSDDDFDENKIVQRVPRKVDFGRPMPHNNVPDGFFPMDEDLEEQRNAGTPPPQQNVLFGTSEEDLLDFPDPEDGSFARNVRRNILAQYGTSLPVDIPEEYWPSNNPANQEVIVSPSSEDEAPSKDPQEKRDRDLFRQFRAQARSVQPADDPERLFGVPAPNRRRYRTAEKQVEPPPLPLADNASLLLAGSNELFVHSP